MCIMVKAGRRKGECVMRKKKISSRACTLLSEYLAGYRTPPLKKRLSPDELIRAVFEGLATKCGDIKNFNRNMIFEYPGFGVMFFDSYVLIPMGLKGVCVIAYGRWRKGNYYRNCLCMRTLELGNQYLIQEALCNAGDCDVFVISDAASLFMEPSSPLGNELRNFLDRSPKEVATLVKEGQFRFRPQAVKVIVDYIMQYLKNKVRKSDSE